MLEIVKFIHEHKDWESLLSNAPYNLKISRDNGFVLFKYNQINSDFNEKICREARGLILDSTDNFKVVRFAFKKFFNYGEEFAAQIDWDSACSMEKIDGSLMSVWFARGKWHLSTNGMINAFNAELISTSPYKTFGELFESICSLSTFDSLDKNFCYTFELASFFNRVVIYYPNPRVFLLSIRDMNTLKEFTVSQVRDFASRAGFVVPQIYNLSNKADILALVKNMGEDHEGIVVRDRYDNRIKIKTLTYLKLHRMRGNGNLSLEDAVDLILANEQHEFLAYFWEYTDYFKKLEKIVNEIFLIAEKWDKEDFRARYESSYSEKVARKMFSNDFAKQQESGFLTLAFKAYDKKATAWLHSLTNKQFCRVFLILLTK